MVLSQQDGLKLSRMRSDFTYFGPQVLKIETKNPEAPLIEFEMNQAQKFLHMVVLAMLALVGFVRIIIVKGRQQGISTYIEGLLYWLVTMFPNRTASIISHEASSTDTLQEKIELFHEESPDNIRPGVLENNGKRTRYSNKSKFLYYTAGTKNTGRSRMSHYQHQSERAFFDNPSEIDAGAGQIVGRFKGTFVFKESTGNGFNHFEKEVNLGSVVKSVKITKDLKFEVEFTSKGTSDYWVVFIPWYWQSEYRAEVPDDFQITPYELELLETYSYNGLDSFEQLQWRRLKIAELDASPRGNGEKWFKQEYPNTLREAFQESGDPYISAELVNKARNSKYVEREGARILGVDCARVNDKNVLTLLQGDQVKWQRPYDGMEQDDLAEIIKHTIEDDQIDMVFIDYAYGDHVIKKLRKDGYGDKVQGIWFGSSPNDKKIFYNKRAEMIASLRTFLKGPNARIPDDETLAADIQVVREPSQVGGKLLFEEKKEIIKRLQRSPDRLDSLLLCFAGLVRSQGEASSFGNFTKNTAKGSGLTTLARVRENKGDIETSKFQRVSSKSRYRRDY